MRCVEMELLEDLFGEAIDVSVGHVPEVRHQGRTVVPN